MLLVSALIHDVGHPGTNNNFQINSGSKMAMIHNDRSVLENHHVSTAYGIMSDPHCNLLLNLTPDQRKEARSGMINIVLGTDMAQHARLSSEFKTAFDQHTEEGGEILEKTFKETAMITMMKMADISNVTRPFKTADKWAAMVQDEFFFQGDMERALGLPLVKNFDRQLVKGPASNGTLGFLQFVAGGFFKDACPRMGGLQAMLDNIASNQLRWERRRDRHAAKEAQETATPAPA